MPIIMLFGPPGSGKGTQSTRIQHDYDINAISTGAILRENIATGTTFGQEAESYMSCGELVPDDIAVRIAFDAIDKEDMKKGFLLDGFPRTLKQAEALDRFLKSKNASLQKVFYFRVATEILVRRIAGRRVCSSCGALYHVDNKPPKNEGICDLCGGKLALRKDDNPETVKKRIEVYEKQTGSLVEYYKKQGILIELDGTLSVDVLQEKINVIMSAEAM